MKATPVGREKGIPLLPDEGRSPGSPCGHCGEFILTPGNGGSLAAYSVFSSMDRIWPQFFLWCLAGVHGCCLDVFHLARLPFFCWWERAGFCWNFYFCRLAFQIRQLLFSFNLGYVKQKEAQGTHCIIPWVLKSLDSLPFPHFSESLYVCLL